MTTGPAAESAHREGQHAGRHAADVAVQRQLQAGRRRLGDRQRHPQHRVGSQTFQVVGAVAFQHHPIDAALVQRIEAQHQLGDLTVDRSDRAEDALAGVRVTAVASLDRLERTGRRAGWHRRPADRPVAQAHLHLDGGVSSRVEDLSGQYVIDEAHVGNAFRS